MEAKVFLWCSKEANKYGGAYWCLIAEDKRGVIIAAIPIATEAAVNRLKDQGVPVKSC